MYKHIINNYSELRLNVKRICKKINRDPNSINIVVVTKNQKVKDISALLNFGHMSFGENREKESYEKWKDIKNQTKILHYIGALQSKKVKNIMDHFNVIETLDSESAAKNISKYIFNKKNQAGFPKIFIQINIGNETQKRGILISDLRSFLNMCKVRYNLSISGAMCMAPVGKPAEKYFALMQSICKETNLNDISMGMSNDYEEAILNGSTNIRIGSLIFDKS